MSDRHSFSSDNFYVGSDNVRCPTVILSIVYFGNLLCFSKSLTHLKKKTGLISSKTDFLYELPHELQNDLRFKILEN